MRYLIPLFLLATAPLFSNACLFVDKQHPVHLDVEGRIAGPAKFRSSRFRDSNVKYADGKAKLYLSFCLDPRNSLSLGIGTQAMRFDWDKNPRFRTDDYYLADISLTWVTSRDQWRWVITGGGTVDFKDADFKESGVLYGVVWGRYAFNKAIAGHIGAFGFHGIKNTYGLPIIGFDWQLAKAWRLHAVFPIDMALRMYVHPHVFFSLKYATFGPWRYPWRASGGIGKFDRAIFNVYSNGVELNANYVNSSNLEAGLGIGWNFGGWIHIKDKHNHHGKYFNYKGAPYGRAYLGFNF